MKIYPVIPEKAGIQTLFSRGKQTPVGYADTPFQKGADLVGFVDRGNPNGARKTMTLPNRPILTYTYGALSRVTKIEQAAAERTIVFFAKKYPALPVLFWKLKPTKRWFLLFAEPVIAQELNTLTGTNGTDANIKADYIMGSIDEVFARQGKSGQGTDGQGTNGQGSTNAQFKTLNYFTDALGSVIRLNDETGAKVVEYQYEPYGKTTMIVSDTNAGNTTDGNAGNTTNAAAALATGNPIQYTGRENDGATNLYYYRARYYSPLYQRFISEDPIGLEGGINKYAYVEGDPVLFVDPLGLWKWKGTPKETTGPLHGNWCGGGWSGGKVSSGGRGMGGAPPVDSMDECCKAHDECYDECDSVKGEKKRACDDKFIACLRKLPSDPWKWPRPPITEGSSDSITYRVGAKIVFGRPDWTGYAAHGGQY